MSNPRTNCSVAVGTGEGRHPARAADAAHALAAATVAALVFAVSAVQVTTVHEHGDCHWADQA